jgi:hypothetical protein
MSVVFDSLWWWRVEYNGQGSPYEVDKTATESNRTEGTDASTAWAETATAAGDAFLSCEFPNVYMDWNFPLNIDYF